MQRYPPATGRTIPARDGQLREREREREKRTRGEITTRGRHRGKWWKRLRRNTRDDDVTVYECIRGIRVCSFQPSPVFSYAPYERKEAATDSRVCPIRDDKRRNMGWIIQMFWLPVLCVLSFSPSSPPARPSTRRALVISARAFVINIKVPGAAAGPGL